MGILGLYIGYTWKSHKSPLLKGLVDHQEGWGMIFPCIFFLFLIYGFYYFFVNKVYTLILVYKRKGRWEALVGTPTFEAKKILKTFWFSLSSQLLFLACLSLDLGWWFPKKKDWWFFFKVSIPHQLSFFPSSFLYFSGFFGEKLLTTVHKPYPYTSMILIPLS